MRCLWGGTLCCRIRGYGIGPLEDGDPSLHTCPDSELKVTKLRNFSWFAKKKICLEEKFIVQFQTKIKSVFFFQCKNQIEKGINRSNAHEAKKIIIILSSTCTTNLLPRVHVIHYSYNYRDSFVLQIAMNMYVVHSTSNILKYRSIWHKQISTTYSRFFSKNRKYYEKKLDSAFGVNLYKIVPCVLSCVSEKVD